ncbi:hypothetical protein YH63_021125 [Afipia massiliensis]|uniref:DUF308 domain-containing protein n=1 Tax=Afipia massiliensis TaxID=211460 RepID=A0A4U6BVE0_9BRAD|nr:hypothetical protein [Afipia massiliensis]TKT73725.1 hypothetical protein YH63_021125 [Afipia massiliensis]
MIALLIGGTVVLCIGLLTVVFGIPIKEFSFGNTMILAGAVVSCTGLVLIGLYFVGREFRNLARRLETGLPAPAVPREPAAELEAPAIRPARAAVPEPPAAPRPMPPRSPIREERTAREERLGREERPAREDTLFTRDQPSDRDRDDFADETGDHGRAPSEPAAWDEHPITRNRNLGASSEPFDPPAEPTPRQRRNIMFSSSRRDKNRELSPRDASASPDEGQHQSSAEDTQRGDAETNAPSPFESAWPQSGRPRQESPLFPKSPLQNGQTASQPAADEQETPEPVRERFPRRADASSVTIVKSGVVDSMAYSLYSDGSIEAQMPEGMVRFASIDELRAHLDQRN